MNFEQNLTAMLRDPLTHLGYSIVCVRVHGESRKIVEILIEHRDGTPITVGDCVKASREISTIFDVENPIHGSYILQVASPGMDRPLVCEADFQRFAGQQVKVTLHTPVQGRRKFRGLLQGVIENKIEIKIVENGIEQVISFSFSDIQKANLVPTFQ